jgi:protoporphyrinogen oxidase
MTHVRTLILGGGMSGLSCAYHLRSGYQLWERSDEPGGLSRSIKKDGFVYDHTGHLLHLRDPYTLKLIPELLGNNLVENQRRAWIYSNGVYTRYPYQANTFGLPPRVIKDCLTGAVDAQLKPRPPEGSPETMRSWVLRTFGTGYGKHFFFPYNEKLWTVSMDELTAEWVAPFVPKPSISEIIDGAFSDQTKKFGYNATFLYPREGGIQALAYAFAKPLHDIKLKQEIVSIDLDKKQAVAATGEIVSYDFLVNTIPLVRFLALAKALPREITEHAGQMRWTSVYNLNLGIERPALSDKHWIYFPEKKYRFYRVGFPMNFSDKMTPPGCSSMYIEIAHKPGHPPPDTEAIQACLDGLYDSGILTRKDKIISQLILPIPIAYVIFDAHRTAVAQAILSYLTDQNVFSIGRFGAWKYSYMEEAILEGKKTAETIDGK